MSAHDPKGPARGSRDADGWLTALYDELRSLAGRYFADQPTDHVLQPTALVHEAYLRLAKRPQPGWTDPQEFFRAAARAMRDALVDQARKDMAAKRGGGISSKVMLPDALGISGANTLDLLTFNEALDRFVAIEPRAAELVVLRHFAGLTVEQAASALGISRSTAEEDWRLARAWLSRELTEARLRPGKS